MPIVTQLGPDWTTEQHDDGRMVVKHKGEPVNMVVAMNYDFDASAFGTITLRIIVPNPARAATGPVNIRPRAITPPPAELDSRRAIQLD